MNGQVWRRDHTCEALTFAAGDTEVIIACLSATEAKLQCRLSVACRFTVKHERHPHNQRLDGLRATRGKQLEIEWRQPQRGRNADHENEQVWVQYREAPIGWRIDG